LPLGAAVVSTMILVLGALGGWRPRPLALVMAGLGVLSLPGLRRLWRLTVPSARIPAPPFDELHLLAGLVSAGAALFLFLMALAPPVDWDTLMYHLEIPRRFLEAGRLHFPDDSMRVSYVNLIHMLYLPLLAAGAGSGPAAISAIFALLLGALVFGVSRRFLPGDTPWLSLATLFASSTLMVVAITPRVDVTLTFFLLAGHFALLIGWHARDRAALYLAALVLGLAVGVKYHALPYILALLPVFAWTAYRVAGSARAATAPLALCGVVGALAAAPWLLKNGILLGAPLYPLLSEPLLTPWLRSITGTAGLPADVDPGLTRIVWSSRTPFNLWDLFLAPERLTIEYEGRFYRTNPLFLTLPLALPLLREPIVLLLAGPALGYLALLLIAYPETNIRYLLPAIPPLTIVAAHLANRVIARRLPTLAVRGGLVVVAVAALVPAMQTAGRWLAGAKPWRYFSGERSAYEYATRHFLPDVPPLARAARLVNHSVPADGTVLLLFEDRAYWFTPRVIEDQNGMHWPLLADRPAAAACLAGTGVTHVLIGWGAADYYLAGGVEDALLRLPELRRFAARCLVSLGRAGGHELYRVRGSPPSPPGGAQR
jgi:hypothetical protein